MVENSSSDFDWNQIVTKSVETSDGKDLGKVDGLQDLYIVVKDGLVDPSYYRIPRDKVEGYHEGKVKLLLSEEEVTSEFQKDNPGYYRKHHDPAESKLTDEDNLGRTSNTVK